MINRKLTIGIDPGKKTGLAAWDGTNGVFHFLTTVDFWGAYDIIKSADVSSDFTVEQVVIEVPSTTAIFAGQRGSKWARNRHTTAKAGADVGGVVREAHLLAEGLERLGLVVTRRHPIGKVDHTSFCHRTGFSGKRTNEHSRDAGMLAYLAAESAERH